MTKRRFRSLVIFALVLALLLGAAVGLRNLLLGRITAAIRSSLSYAGLHLSIFPLRLVFDDVRTVAATPFFSARRVEVRVSPLSLLARQKSLRVVIEAPVFRFSDAPAAEGQKGLRLNALPFSIERGVIRDGEVFYYGAGNVLSAKAVQAVFEQKRDAFTLRAESGTVLALLNLLGRPLAGSASAVIEGRGREIVVRRATIAGQDFILKAQGALTSLSEPQFEFQTSIHAPAKLVADLFLLPFVWDGRVEGDGVLSRRQGAISFRTACRSRDLSLNGGALGNVDGEVDVGPGSGRVSLALRPASGLPGNVDIAFDASRLTGVVRNVLLDPVIDSIKIPWPVKSPAWGDFTLEKGALRAKAEFRDDLGTPVAGRFPFRGPAEVFWDGKNLVHVASPNLETTFGAVGVEGDIDIGRSLQVVIRGDVTDVGQARAFTEIILKSKLGIPEIRGAGRAEVKILGDYAAPQVKIDFSLAPGGYDRFDAAAVSGVLEVVRKEATGLFKVEDTHLRGTINLATVGSAIDVRIRADDAALETVLPALDILFPLTGRASGEFGLTSRDGRLVVKGTFASPRLELARQPLKDVRGALEWAGAEQRLAFPDLQAAFSGGQVKGSGSYRFGDRAYDLDLDASGLDVASLLPGLRGRAAVHLKGQGAVGKDPARGKLTAVGLAFAGFERIGLDGDLILGYDGRRVALDWTGVLSPGRNDVAASFSYPQDDGSYKVNLKGRLANFDLVMPWPGIQGEANFLGEIRAGSGAPQVTGAVDIKGAVFPFPRFAQALTDYDALVYFQNDAASIRSFQAKFGGGDITGSGDIRFGPGGIASLDVRAEGKNMVLAFLERTRALADGSFRLVKDPGRFLLTGDVLVRNLNWRRELSEKWTLSSGPEAAEAKKTPGIFDGLDLDVRLRSTDDALLENSLGRVQGRFDLTISGTVATPVLLGDIEGVRGTVNFQEREFRLLKARLSFFNPAAIEPYLDFQGETFLKDYRVTFSLNGLIDRLKPEFASSPPLPGEDVLALLALGESFKRSYSYDRSSQLGTGALLSAQLTEDAKKRAERLFSLDRFSIDPFLLGASTEMTARLTVGKKISRNIVLLYSTNLTSQREEIIRLDWAFSESFSLVGMRDERGRISFDAKIRKRF
jgi:autotransporter translocation and assembly factor TamB